MISYDSLYIGGEWRTPSSCDSLTITSASTGLDIGHVPISTHADADAAVAAARKAFNDPTGWARWEPAERAAALLRLANELDARKEEMARRVSAQNGMPYSTSLNFGSGPLRTRRLMGGRGRRKAASYTEAVPRPANPQVRERLLTAGLALWEGGERVSRHVAADHLCGVEIEVPDMGMNRVATA